MTKSNNLLADYAAKKQDICIKNDTISDSLFREYGVNRGLRDVNGKGLRIFRRLFHLRRARMVAACHVTDNCGTGATM